MDQSALINVGFVHFLVTEVDVQCCCMLKAGCDNQLGGVIGRSQASAAWTGVELQLARDILHFRMETISIYLCN